MLRIILGPFARNLCSLFVLLTSFGGISHLLGQMNPTSNLEFYPLTFQQALPSEDNNAVFRDSRGLLWLANDQGLLKYDGFDLITYSCDSLEEICWPEGRIQEIKEGNWLGEQVLWISGSQGAGWLQLNTETIFPIDIPFPDFAGSPMSPTLPLPVDDSLLLIGWEDLLYVYHPTTVEQARYRIPPQLAHVPQTRIKQLLPTADQDWIWIVAVNQLLKFHLPTGAIEVESSLPFPDFLLPLRQGGWMAVNRENELYHWEQGATSFEKVSQVGGAATLINDLEEGPEDELYVGTNQGLFVLNANWEVQATYVAHGEKGRAFPTNVIKDVYWDSRGFVWLALYKGGILLSEMGRSAFAEHALPQLLPESEAKGEIVTSFLRDQRGWFWLGTYSGRLLVRTPEGLFPIQQITHDDQQFQPSEIVSLVEDGMGNLWIGGFRWGVLRIEAASLQSADLQAGILRAPFAHFTPESPPQQRLKGWSVRQMVLDSLNQVWVATIDGGLTCYSPDMQGVQHFPVSDTAVLGIWSLKAGKGRWQGTWFIGTHRNGVYVLEADAGKMGPLPMPRTAEMPRFRVRDLLQVPGKSDWWVATSGKGLIRMIAPGTDSCRWASVTDLPYVSNQEAFSLILDQQGAAWARINQDVYQLPDPYDTPIKQYSNQKGLIGDFFLNAHYQDPSTHELYFGKSNGFLSLQPELTSKPTPLPTLLFTSLKISNQSFEHGQKLRGKVILTQHIHETQALRLKRANSTFTLGITTLDFRPLVQSDYRFRLEGYESEWHHLPAGKQAISYANLPVGTYQLRVELQNVRGHHTPPSIDMKLIIEPEIYQQAWFSLLLVVIILGSVYLLIKVRTTVLRRQNAALAEKVTLRTQELQSSYENIRMLSEWGRTLTSHREPENIISSLYHQLNQLMDASSFYLGQALPETNEMKYLGYPSPLAPTQINRRKLTDLESLSIWSYHHQRELFLSDVPREASMYLGPDHHQRYQHPDSAQSLISIPLQIGQKCLGVLVVKSYQKGAFSEQNFNILSNLASYLAVALENAKAYQQVQEQSLARTRFYNNLSHELRTPLTLIVSPLEELMKQKGPASQQEDLRLVHRHAHRMQGVLDQLLELGQLEEGVLQANIQPVELNGLLRRMHEAFGLIARQKSQRWELHIPEEEVWLPTDEGMLEKILYNLISNALKYSPEQAHIGLSYERNDTSCTLLVHDNGPGIPPTKQQQIFERFQAVEETGEQIESAEGRPPSIGLGLAFVQKLVSLLDGQVEIQSDVHAGTTVRVHLPWSTATPPSETSWLPATPLPSLPPQRSASEETGVLSPKEESARILIAEDHPDLQAYLYRSLSPHYELCIVADGAEALSKIESFDPDLILSDIMMPGMNGLELVERIKTSDAFNHLPVVLLTARAEDADRITGLTYGADAYLTKPFSLSLLRLKLKNLLTYRQNLLRRYTEEAPTQLRPVPAHPRDAAFLERMYDILESELGNPYLNVDFLAQELGMSRTLLFNKLKLITGESGKTLLNNYKMNKAMEWLRSGKHSVAEVSMLVGYAEPKYFSQAFKRHTGQPPSSYLPPS